MGEFFLGPKSRERLVGVHPDLIRVIERVIKNTPTDFEVLEGLRTLKREQELVKTGASTTTHSRHLTGHAVDLGVLVGGQVTWDYPFYEALAGAVKAAAAEEGVPVEWGGDWHSFKDGTHFQLPWAVYPVEEPSPAA